MTQTAERARLDSLRDAESKAVLLFDETIARGLVVPGVGERELSDQIRELAGELFGIRRFWHKRIVRAGVNTLLPYDDNPPDRRLAADDILFFDFGPIFEDWEADVGRTYVPGDDPVKRRLADDLPVLWESGRAHFAANLDLTGAQLFSFVTAEIAAAGWGHGAEHTGHLIGEFPHERIPGDQRESYLTPMNNAPLRRVDSQGKQCHWILEVHLVDRERGFGGFFEQLLDIAPDHVPAS